MTTQEINEVDLNLTQTEEEGVGMWHAIFTLPRHEKVVARQLQERRIDSFLPMFGKFHRWKDRKKFVLLPIFPGYVFVRICRAERLTVLQLSGVIRFISFGGSPAEVPEAELRALRASIESGASLEPHRYLTVGRRVKVCRGPLQQTEGILIRKKGRHRLVLSIDSIQRSLAVEVDVEDVSPILEAGRSSKQSSHRTLAAISNSILPVSQS